jgi:hypothetical protein
MQNNIDSIAYQLFRHWTKNAAYDYPDLDFTIVDERTLVTDLKEAFERAVEMLTETEKTEKRRIPGYDYGYIIGFVQGKINSLWGFEYITKQGKDFKRFLINKALLVYLEYEPISAIKIKAIYEKMYEESSNIEYLDYELPQNRITDYKIDELHDNNFSSDKNNPVIIFLKNQISEQLLNLIKIEVKDYLPKMEEYVSRKLVRELIYNK